MMMFASDLDRTLIYSNRALADFKQHTISDLIAVELKDAQEVAFMTNNAYSLLKELAASLLFIPVTTRTYEQYKRVFIFTESFHLKYAVTSNGATIIYNGLPLQEWRETVQKRLENECVPFQKMMEEMFRLPINGTLKKVENLFFYYLLEEPLTLETKNRIQKMADRNGWRISIQGRKLYLMPKPVCKGEAVKFIKEREGIQTVFGAGDSILDNDFLKLCDYAYVPSHGELKNEGIGRSNYLFTAHQGVLAGEEILHSILNTVTEKST
ncbi:HAD family hydrolase [Cytobacillus massiliigabonensis]|uniref:HAD family hydrolase n=1 Tax=Cytobacillus massiliigabonensis TaxID=1871011 RepID=UPI000C822758|nr:HAD family hydrolase [Cytobacillus massiliigabonensis]